MASRCANLLLCFVLGIAAAFLSKYLYVSLGWFDLRYDASGRTIDYWLYIEGFIVAAVLHGLYDFVVLINPGWSLPVAATGILLLWVWRLKLLRALHLDAVNREE